MFALNNVGPIRRAQIDFADLTVLVGPQAAGKSIALQIWKLLLDAGQIQGELSRYGLDWDKKLERFFNIYLGEGMGALWDGNSSLARNGRAVDLPRLAARKSRKKEESLFFIPAQRVLTLHDGWPRPFTDYSPGDPFVVREFSERLRILVEQMGSDGNLFPQPRRLSEAFRKILIQHVFADFRLSVDKTRQQKRLVLGRTESETLPYMVWSAGQREFVPLLLGLYWLMPRSAATKQKDVDWVVLEELELGLHPRAVAAAMMLVFSLLQRGYRVCLSTHSTQVLDALWALKHLRGNHAGPKALLDIFDVGNTTGMQNLAESALGKSVNVYYFDRDSGIAQNISNLDPTAEHPGEGGWGGLSEFSGRANEAVAHAVSDSMNAAKGSSR
ncbi:MAG: AAA family ATPase [Terriglobales bacterium]